MNYRYLSEYILLDDRLFILLLINYFKLQRNGRWSAGKRSRHLDIKIFYIKDQIDKGLLDVKYCPTDQMMADYMTKSLQGSKFGKQRRFIMNLKEPSKANNYTLHKKMRNKKISK